MSTYNEQPFNEDRGDERRSIRALRLTPLKDVEKTPAMRRTVPTQPPVGYRDTNEDRPLGIERRPRRRWTWIHTAFIAGSVVLLGVLAYPIAFPKATVTVTPRTSSLSFTRSTFTASKDGSEGVRYSLAPIVVSDTVSVPASQKKQVDAKASGTITIHNTALTTPQRLIKNTRFESKDGNIYRIRESVVVPGYTEKDGSRVPGSLEVTVYADEPGPAYNVNTGTFTVPGLKDKADLYAGITATVTKPIVGGSTGVRFVISDSDRAAATKKIDADLLIRAKGKAEEVLTDTTMTLRGANAYTYRDVPDGEEGTNVIVGREITYTQMVFSRSEFAEYLRGQSTMAVDLPDTPARVTNASALSLSLDTSTDSAGVFGSNIVNFSLSGTPVLVWDVDTDALARDLDGASRSLIPEILKKNPTIGAGTKVDIMPFWNNTMPSASRIMVTVVGDTK